MTEMFLYIAYFGGFLKYVLIILAILVCIKYLRTK